MCFKGGYIDSWGRGTIKILDTCKADGLPEPEIKETDGGVMITMFNVPGQEANRLESYVGLNQRQQRAIEFLKENGKITNSDYFKLNGVSRQTATRDLKELLEKFSLVEKIGDNGAGIIYVLRSNWLIIDS